MNQLRLCRQLTGSLEVGPGGVRLHARGQRPDEVIISYAPFRLEVCIKSHLWRPSALTTAACAPPTCALLHVLSFVGP